ncbi:MAG: site-2 protease family protein [Parcubacteria group bacterium CG08_land_8_20_14_0_20_48_21]|nr:MAG: hypothetical protein AUK21_00585 [Parcubacteria group bacterium CG2_30_48_51]PIS32533.1 MAG: site-2 protease family protein [Parcubacteria group bacterium CG08_land_8_20_14_0_20_48_21]PIW79484.1 MAG: site-2 protease family protein [Parcubacteria group bacterium CG_4_8_14_3_um_filter_48_16]PIY77915.1 MAG: site-2 protease family protein [Parcubacteria group bacterium CG_4_10_14_0_8_um_filter_48_154]PIZ77780.1 MAG: site-2 protease family protein [bacterium CG_4_10_14_0_2_um_filter_48_144]
MSTTILLLFFFLVIVPSAIMHEYAHGWMADKLGDPTARYAGRLTINPIAHIDPVGTILLPMLMIISNIPFLFAYAKPVPYNPYNLRNPKRDAAWVGVAGPLANLAIAVTVGLMIRFLPPSNFTLLLSIIVYANVLLMVFNLVPIPPLDGSKVLYALLPDSPQMLRFKMLFEQYGVFFLLIFIFFFFQLIVPIISFIYTVITGSESLF